MRSHCDDLYDSLPAREAGGRLHPRRHAWDDRHRPEPHHSVQTRRDFLISTAALGLASPASRGALTAPMRVPVWVDGRGPYSFIVDTGASRSALAAHCMTELPRSTRTEDLIRLHTQTGSVDVPSVAISSMSTAAGAAPGLRRLPVLPRQALVSADGLLGADALAGTLLRLDFVAGTAELSAPSSAAPSSSSPSPASAQASTQTRAHDGSGSTHGRWRVRPPVEAPVSFDAVGRALVDTRIGRGTVRALVDTGAQRSIAAPGLALLEPATAGASGEAIDSGLRGAAGSLLTAIEATLPALRIGARRWPAGPVLVAPLPAVAPPAPGVAVETLLLLGLDRLAALEWLVLDYARARLVLSPLRDGRG